MSKSPKKKVLITGAAGGMGRACARLFGLTYDLVLNDVNEAALAGFAADLEQEGFTVSAVVAGSTCDDAVLGALVDSFSGGEAFAIVHTAGLSPSQAEWQLIMRVNLLGSAKLIDAFEPLVVAGTVAVLIASTAGHGLPSLLDADAILAEPLEPDLVGRIGPTIDAMAPMAGPAGAGGVSYSLSKQGVLRLAERKAMDWGPLGGRVVTISPGLMLTPMGRQELAKTPGAEMVLNAAPVGRPGTALDVASVAHFLASPEAGFISGSDVRVDGGAVSALQIMAKKQQFA